MRRSSFGARQTVILPGHTGNRHASQSMRTMTRRFSLLVQRVNGEKLIGRISTRSEEDGMTQAIKQREQRPIARPLVFRTQIGLYFVLCAEEGRDDHGGNEFSKGSCRTRANLSASVASSRRRGGRESARNRSITPSLSFLS